MEHIAGIEGYQVVLATFRACQRWPGMPITLRQGARVIEDSRRLILVGACECTMSWAEVRWLTHSRLKSHQYRCNLVHRKTSLVARP